MIASQEEQQIHEGFSLFREQKEGRGVCYYAADHQGAAETLFTGCIHHVGVGMFFCCDAERCCQKVAKGRSGPSDDPPTTPLRVLEPLNPPSFTAAHRQ